MSLPDPSDRGNCFQEEGWSYGDMQRDRGAPPPGTGGGQSWRRSKNKGKRHPPDRAPGEGEDDDRASRRSRRVASDPGEGFRMPNCADQDVGTFDIGIEDQRWMASEQPAVEPCPLCCMASDDSRRIAVENIMREELCGFKERCMKAHSAYDAIRASCGEAAPAEANLVTMAVHANDHDVDLAGQQSRYLSKLTSIMKHLEQFLHPVTKGADGTLKPLAPPANLLKEYASVAQRRQQLLMTIADAKCRRAVATVR